ncbi:MAG: ATP-grasp domain-containing protein [Candidatus Thorarchaeota archaeon]
MISPRYLKTKKIAVIGFNARPLACSVKKLGAEVFVSDYWGDSDLTSCCHEWVSVLSPQSGKRQREKLEVPVPVALVENILSTFSETAIDYVLVGSGFDDHPELLNPIEKQWSIKGNSSQLMKSARHRKAIESLATKNGFCTPKEKTIHSLDEGMNLSEEIGFPCVIRPMTSGGGSGIRIVLNATQLREILASRDLSKGIILQQYISGSDYSLSLLCNGMSSFTLSIQGQLIGMASAGRNSDFVYCGNYMPSGLPKSVLNKLRLGCENIGNALQLKGSNGFDVVITPNETICLMEINPRIQGTLELVELSGNVSVSRLHIEASDGNLPTAAIEFLPSVKMIVYANKHGIVPDLSKYPNTVDRSPIGVLVERGDPICSIIEKGASLTDVYSTAIQTSNQIRQTL